jgi:hypothetical protein
MSTPLLTPEEVQKFIRDYASNNRLLDGEEFDPTIISFAINLAISEFNSIPPLGSVNLYSFPSKAVLLSGTLYKLFAGQAALLARNTMSYTDGGLTIPVEERFQLYQALASMFQADFMNAAKAIKIEANIEDGWGGVYSDYITHPIW